MPFTKMEKSGSGSDVEPLGANKLHLLLVLSLSLSFFPCSLSSAKSTCLSLLVIPKSKQISS